MSTFYAVNSRFEFILLSFKTFISKPKRQILFDKVFISIDTSIVLWQFIISKKLRTFLFTISIEILTRKFSKVLVYLFLK